MSSTVTTHTAISGPAFGHAWRDKRGELNATVNLGSMCSLYFGSAEDARAVAAACTEAAEAIGRLAAESSTEEGTGDG